MGCVNEIQLVRGFSHKITTVFDDDPHWVNGETLFPGFANATARGTISFTFEGM